MPLLFLPILALLLAGCAKQEGQPQAGGGPGGELRMAATIPAVEVIQARLGALPLEERLTGTVRAENQIAIFPEITSPIVRVAVQTGASVEAGEPLVYLRDTQFREQLKQAEAALKISQAESRRSEASLRELRSRLERVKQLADKQFQSQQELEILQAEFDAAEATYEQTLGRIDQAEATVEEARESLRRTVVRAPISGLVGQRNAEVGMRADNSTHLFTIGNFDVVRVAVSITDEMMSRIKVGQTALVRLDDPTVPVIEAEVSRISPFLEAGNYSAGAEIDIPNEERILRPGMFVTVDVLYGESQQATLLPLSALYEDPRTGVLGVFVATSLGSETPMEEPEYYDAENPPVLSEPTPMAFRQVEVLARGRGLAGVRGVKPGDWVVTVGQNLLSSPTPGQLQARARPVSWERIAELQNMQDQDLLRQFMEKQQRMAREAYDNVASEETSSLTSDTDTDHASNTAP